MAGKRASSKPDSPRVFGQGAGRRETPCRVGLYARVSTHDQQTLPMQLHTMRAYAKQRGWSIGMEVRDVGSGANVRPQREAMLKAARRRELDIIMVWRLDRWGRSLLDLIGTLQELNELGVGFVSLSEALDLTTASGAPWPACCRSSPSSSATFCGTVSRPGSHRHARRGGLMGDPQPSSATPTKSASSTRKGSARARSPGA